MSVIAEFTVDADDFALHHALTAAPEMIVEIERVVATVENEIMPYFWVSGGDESAFYTAFNEDPSVRCATLVDEIDDAVLYRAEWTENVQTIIYAYTEIGATILQATGRDECWELQMRFDDRDKVAQFRAYCTDHDIPFKLTGIYQQEEPMASAQYGLTPKQRQTLVTALDAGYFEVPQRSTMSELATELGISQQALSKRLHHAHRNLITNALTISHPDDG